MDRRYRPTEFRGDMLISSLLNKGSYQIKVFLNQTIIQVTTEVPIFCKVRCTFPHWQILSFLLLKVQDQDSLLVKHRNDNHSPGPVIRELVPSSHQRSELSNTILCIFSRWDQRTGEGIPIPDSLGEKATFIYICISNGSLKCHRVLISTMPSLAIRSSVGILALPLRPLYSKVNLLAFLHFLRDSHFNCPKMPVILPVS